MADKPIDQLDSANRISETDLFVLQQSGEAKKLAGQVLIDWLTERVDKKIESAIGGSY